MSYHAVLQRRAKAPSHYRRAGTGALDLLVSFTLLVTAMSVAVPLVFQHGRVLKSQRNYRLALDEAANQLESLTSRSPDLLPEIIRVLAPSEFLQQRLRGVKLSGELQPAEFGTRIVLKLSWVEANRQAATVTLVGWAAPAAATRSTTEDNAP